MANDSREKRESTIVFWPQPRIMARHFPLFPTQVLTFALYHCGHLYHTRCFFFGCWYSMNSPLDIFNSCSLQIIFSFFAIAIAEAGRCTLLYQINCDELFALLTIINIMEYCIYSYWIGGGGFIGRSNLIENSILQSLLKHITTPSGQHTIL